MKRQAKRVFILAVCVVVIMLISGCEEQGPARKNRLIATENIRLKEQLEQCEVEVEKQRALKEQSKERVAGLMNDISEERVAGLMNVMNKISKTVGEENKKLREENKTLKVQIKQLEAQVVQLEKELEERKKAVPEPLPSAPNSL